MGVLEKVRRFKEKRPKNSGGRSRTLGIFHNWKDGDNKIRLIGEFLEVKTHFLPPVPKRGDRGLCQPDAFDRNNEDRIPKVVNCPDWNIDNEEDTGEKKCPICKLHRLAIQALKEEPDDEEKEYFDFVKGKCGPRTSLKWNIFDRENPNVKVVDENGNESERKGAKIATIGMEAWNDIEGIFEQVGGDITDPNEGVDINVKRGHNGTRVEYSAQVVLDGKGLKVTPFDEEEQEIVSDLPDLKAICGKQTEPDAVLAALHGDLRELLELNEEIQAGEGHASEGYDSYGDDDDDVLGGTE